MGSRFTDGALVDMVRMYGEGLSAETIGKRLEPPASAATVLRALRAEGVTIRSVGRKAAEGEKRLGRLTLTQAMERRAAGVKQSAIAEEAGVSRQAVSAVFKREDARAEGRAA